jgi:hypothetical protein
MTVQELIDTLACLDENMEVRIAMQPHYPFEYSISSSVATDDERNILYLSEDDQKGYLSGDIAQQLGWGK